MSELDDIIPAEIKNDQFYELIRTLSEQETLSNVLEIGSSSGAGSTEAFARGLAKNKNSPKLFCLEVSRARHQALSDRYKNQPFVHVYHASSIPVEKFMTPAEVEKFYRESPTNLNQYPLDQVLGWLEQDIKYVQESDGISNGIETIKKENGIDWFDLVLIDGSAFTGMGELSEVIGAEHILLDDVNDIKCLDAYKYLRLAPDYQLVTEDWSLRNGFAYFRRNTKLKRESVFERRNPAAKIIPLHAFTIVLNGFPFIQHHIEVLRRLEGKWHWHIVEGVADLIHDTAWSVELGGRIDPSVHRDGRSNDGTTEYLDQLKALFPDNISIYRKPPGTFWSGKLEMVNAPLDSIRERCVLLQVDSDELWSVSQIETLRSMFHDHPEKSAAYFFCDYYVGEDLAITSRDTYGNNSSYEWLRAWRYEPGVKWAAHEPPRLCHIDNGTGRASDLAAMNPFMHHETERRGLVFQHYAYVTAAQLEFKKSYYGYRTALEDWARLTQRQQFPCRLADYFSWVKDAAIVDRVDTAAPHILARTSVRGEWSFWPFGSRPDREAAPEPSPAQPEINEHLLRNPDYQPGRVLLIRSDSIGDLIMTSSILKGLRSRFPRSSIVLVCQNHIAPLFEHCDLIDSVISFDKKRLLESEAHQIEFTTSLRKLNPDLVINGIVSPDPIAHLLTIGSQGKVSLGVGAADTCNIEAAIQQRIETQYTFLLPYRQGNSEMTMHRRMLENLGVSDPDLQPQIWLDSGDESYIDQFLTSHGLIPGKVIAVFGSAQFPQKNYAEFGAAVSQLCKERGLGIITLGDHNASALNEYICKSSGVAAVNASGRLTLRQSAAALKRSVLAVGVDTSLAHMACAVGIRNVIVMGGGHFGRFMPYSPLTSLVTLPLECYGCNWYCRYQRVHCVQDIAPRSIEQAIRESLDGSAVRPRIYTQRPLSNVVIPSFRSPERLVDQDVEYIQIL